MWEKELWKLKRRGRAAGQGNDGRTKSRGDMMEKGARREQTQDRAAWRRLVQYIDPSRSGIRCEEEELLEVSLWSCYLKHLVRTRLDARHHVGRREGSLLHLSEVVLRVTVETEPTHRHQGKLSVRPHLATGGETRLATGGETRLAMGGETRLATRGDALSNGRHI